MLVVDNYTIRTSSKKAVWEGGRPHLSQRVIDKAVGLMRWLFSSYFPSMEKELIPNL